MAPIQSIVQHVLVTNAGLAKPSKTYGATV